MSFSSILLAAITSLVKMKKTMPTPSAGSDLNDTGICDAGLGHHKDYLNTMVYLVMQGW